MWTSDGSRELELLGHRGAVTACAVSPSGRTIATASVDGTVRLWEASSGKELVSMSLPDEVWSVVFSPEGDRVLASGGSLFGPDEAAVATEWHLDGTRRRVFPRHGGWVIRAVYSPRGDRVATAAADGTVRIWTDEGALEREIAAAPGEWITGVAFSPDGRTILTTSSDCVARLWDSGGALLAELTGHKHWILSGAFSPDGDAVVTGSMDRTARVWDLQGRELAILDAHSNAVSRRLLHLLRRSHPHVVARRNGKTLGGSPGGPSRAGGVTLDSGLHSGRTSTLRGSSRGPGERRVTDRVASSSGRRVAPPSATPS